MRIVLGDGRIRIKMEPEVSDVDFTFAVTALSLVLNDRDHAPGYALAAILAREDPRDAFLSTRYASLAALPAGGSVIVRTEGRSDRVTLSIEDTGTSLSADALEHLFDPNAGGRDAGSRLQLAASKSLVQRLKGSIRAANRPEGGIVLTVELPAAATHSS